MVPLPVGKLPAELLRQLLGRVKVSDEQVVLGPRVGEDAAVVRVSDRLLVFKTDPVTFASDLIGWYAVHVNANDIATRGVRPRWFLATILLPQGVSAKEAKRIFQQILDTCQSIGVSLVGGHTEITHGLNRPVVVGCMIGEAESGRIVNTSGARPGDNIVLTKGIAIEGTAVLAREAAKTHLLPLDPDIIQRAANYLFEPGISVLREAMTAFSSVDVTSMHDPTEGGLCTGLAEVASAAGVGVVVREDQIFVLPECRAICDHLGLNPLGLLASGALIITLPSLQTGRLLELLEGIGIGARVIGKVVEAEQGAKVLTESGVIDLPVFARDELARFLDRPDPG